MRQKKLGSGPQRSTGSAGYCGTLLARKLGFKEGSHVLRVDAPVHDAEWVKPLPSLAVDIAHVFVTQRIALQARLSDLRTLLGLQASIWISWPKKAANIPTAITDQTIRELALPLGFVDIKVYAVNEVWSGLKRVVRKELC